MSTPALHVQRLSATVRTAGRAGDSGRVDRMLHRLADRRLDEALRTVTLPPGHWCVRRVDVPIRLDPDRPDGVVEAEWARLLIAGLRQAIAQLSPDVVHYRHERDALADLVASVATGRREHAWAWSALGLLPAGQPAPGGPAGAVILTALRRQPQRALAAIITAVRRTGAAALDRAFGVAGWTAVATLVRAAATGSADPVPASGPPELVPTVPDRPAPAVPGLAAALVRSSELATALGGGRLRPVAATRAAWAVLVVADADPGLLSRPVADAVVAAVAGLLPPAATTPSPVEPARPVRVPAPGAAAERAGTASPAGRPAGAPTRARVTAAAGATGDVAGAAGPHQPVDPATATRSPRTATARPPARRVAAEPAPEPPAGAEPAAAWPTIWAGLPFLLAVAADAGIPAAIGADPVLAARPLRWTLHAIGRALVPADPDDPAALALAGLGPEHRPPSALGDPAEPAEQARIDELARGWAAAVAARLPAPSGADPADPGADPGCGVADPAGVVLRVARRAGRVVADPGWIDVHLRLDEVDVDVRRAGLDLDPGWVPWLGTVVRFVYA